MSAPAGAARVDLRAGFAAALPTHLGLGLASTILLAVIPLERFGFGGEGIAGVLFVAVLVALALKDLEERRIPNLVVLPAAALVLIGVAWFRPDHALESVGAAFAAAGFLLVPTLFVRGAVGMGDVKLGFLIGAALGLGTALAFILGCLAASVVAVVLLFQHGSAARKMAVPFAPFLVLGALAAIALGASHAL
jgi:prepilin signal peptidase PulO-like enzyme (type II secretory pathway)